MVELESEKWEERIREARHKRHPQYLNLYTYIKLSLNKGNAIWGAAPIPLLLLLLLLSLLLLATLLCPLLLPGPYLRRINCFNCRNDSMGSVFNPWPTSELESIPWRLCRRQLFTCSSLEATRGESSSPCHIPPLALDLYIRISILNGRPAQLQSFWERVNYNSWALFFPLC